MALNFDVKKAFASAVQLEGGLSGPTSNLNLVRTFLGGLAPNDTQTDVAHMTYFRFHGLPFNLFGRFVGLNTSPIALPNPCFSEPKDNCRSEHFFGSWFDSQVCMNEEPEGARANEIGAIAYVESLMLCKPPHFFNTGSHRVASVLWFKGERYAVAFEEGGMVPSDHMKAPCNKNDVSCFASAIIASLNQDSINENFFVEPLTRGAANNIGSARFILDELIPAAVLAITGNKLYDPAHRFKIYVEDFQSGGVLVNGCEMSERVFKF